MSANGASPTPLTRDLNACELRDRARHRLSSSVLSAAVLATALSTAIAMPRALPADDRTELQSRYAAAENKLKAGEHSPEVWQEILETLYRLDQPRKALGAARVAAKELARHPEVVGYIARAYFRGGFADEAAKLFDKFDPQIGGAVLATALSKLLHSEGRSRQALAAALSGLEHAPDDPELLYQAALLQAWFGNNAAAAALFESASKHARSLKGYPKDLLISRARARALIYQAAGDKPTNAVTHTGAIPFRIGQNLRLPSLSRS